jgi:hypothetical protein
MTPDSNRTTARLHLAEAIRALRADVDGERFGEIEQHVYAAHRLLGDNHNFSKKEI